MCKRVKEYLIKVKLLYVSKHTHTSCLRALKPTSKIKIVNAEGRAMLFGI